MRKLLNCLLIINLVAFLCGCCCPCGKKQATDSSQNTEQTKEQAPSN